MEIISPDSIQAFLQTAGYLGLFALIFIESGLLVGIFLPGDSVLFTAGFLASQGYFDITTLIIGTFIASILGDNFGFILGRKFGKEIFNREKSLFFNKKYIEQAQEFYELHGKKTAEKIVLELKDKLGGIESGSDMSAGMSSDMDAIEALRALGYDADEAREALKKIDPKIEDTGKKVKAALKMLG
jgi:hypothetical protein